MLWNFRYEEKHVEFVDYTGRYPHLCHGVLTLMIDGKPVTFGSAKADFPCFWCSGGSVQFDSKMGEHVTSGEWIIDADVLPKEYRKYAIEIDYVFNKNVEHGCCGGCV